LAANDKIALYGPKRNICGNLVLREGLTIFFLTISLNFSQLNLGIQDLMQIRRYKEDRIS